MTTETWNRGSGTSPPGAATSTGCAAGARLVPPSAGPAGRGAPWRSPSTPTTRPSRCATARPARASSPRASTAPASRSRRSCALLAEHGVPASFFMPAVSALLHPDEVEAYVDGRPRGRPCTAGSTSATCCSPATTSSTSPAEPLETLEKLSGVRPVGIRTPSWDFSDHTLDIIRGARPSLRLVADGRRRALRAARRRAADRHRGDPGRVDPRRRALPDDGALRGAAALHAAARRCSTSGATSSTPPTPRAGSSSSPCTRTSSGTAPASSSCASCSRTSRPLDDVWFATHAQIADVARAQLTSRRRPVMSETTTAPGAPSETRLTGPAAQGDRRRLHRQRRRMGGLGRLRARSPRSSPRSSSRSGDPTAALLSTLAVFAVGFVMRPIGGALLGVYADRHGRKKGLTLTIGLMAGGGDHHRGLPHLRGDRRRRAAGPAAGPAGAGLLRGRRVRLVLLVPGRVGRASSAGVRGLVAAGLGRRGRADRVGDGLRADLDAQRGRDADAGAGASRSASAGCSGLVGLWLRVSVEETESFQRRRARRAAPAGATRSSAMLTEHPRAALRVVGITIAGTLHLLRVDQLHARLRAHRDRHPAREALLANTIAVAYFLCLLPFVALLSDRYRPQADPDRRSRSGSS